MKRRDFLKISTLTGAGAWLNPYFSAEALANQVLKSGVDGALVLIVVKDGMDVTLGLDPWLKLPEGIDNKDLFLEYTSDKVFEPQAGMLLGPAAKALVPHASDFAIVNGIFQNDLDNGHDANLQYIKTGNGAGLAPSAGVAACDSFGKTPLGLLVLDTNPFLVSKKVSITSIRDVTRWALGSDLSSIVKAQVEGKIETKTELVNSQQAVIDLSPYRQQLVSRLKKLHTSNEEIKTLVACLSSGVAKLAEIEIRPPGESLDTHSDHLGRHLAGQSKVWEQISELFKLAKQAQYKNSKSSLFDKTTFVVVSDFGRTPFLNSNNGKDHNPNTNSVLIAGRGVKGGQVIGKSLIISRNKSPRRQAIHTGSPIDLKTFEPIKSIDKAEGTGVDFLYPENVMATVYQCAGISLEGASKTVLSKIVKVPG